MAQNTLIFVVLINVLVFFLFQLHIQIEYYSRYTKCSFKIWFMNRIILIFMAKVWTSNPMKLILSFFSIRRLELPLGTDRMQRGAYQGNVCSIYQQAIFHDNV